MLLNQPKIIFLKLCCLILIFNIQYVSSVQPRVVCYYTNWSVYRPGTAKFNPQNINPYLCTHLIYAFGGFTKDNTLKPFDKYQDIEQGGYAKFTGLKTYNKELKTLLAIGGWNEGSVRFSPLVANANRRQSFVKNVIKFLRQNRFDGLDLDWEYPAFRDGGKPRDRDNYAKLVQELREEFERESSKTQRPRLLLTMAVPAGLEYIEKGYDVPKLNQYLDWFNLLSYDYHSAYEPSVNHHSPLYGENEDDEYNYDVDLNINATINYYLNAGAEREKLVLGIPTYGRSYTLFNPDSHEIGSPADGPGEQGDSTREKGYLAYYEICQNINDPDNGWTVVQQDPEKYGPYAYSDNQWVGYDDEEIVRKKSKFVVEQDLGGIMFWSIDNDDFRGLCGGKPYPLIEAAKESLLNYIENGRNSVPSTRNRISGPTKTRVQEEAVISSKPTRRTNQRTRTTTPTTTTTTKRTTVESINFKTTTPAPPTTPDQGSDFKCEEEGFFEHPRDCKKYFWCLETAELGIVAHSFTCPSGLYFNKLADSCDYARNVLCNKSKSTTTTTSTTSTTTNRPTTSVYDRNVETSTYRNPLFARTSTTTTTTTTTPAYEEYEYDLDDEDVDDGHLEQEDPKVIKELINLIKKVGGLDELEKQLKLSDDSDDVVEQPKKTDALTTPPTIKKSLYERVLQRANQNKNRFNGGTQSLLSTIKDTIKTDDDSKNNNNNNKPKYEPVKNRGGPQNSGLDKLPEFEGFLKEKPQYVTITRTRLSSANDQDEDDEDEEENDSDEEYIIEEAPKRKLNENKYQYTDIRRNRPNQVVQKSEEESDDDEVEDTTTIRSRQPSYVQSSRQRTRAPEEVTTAAPTDIPSRNTFRYQTFSRQRYSTQRPNSNDESVTDDDSESVGTTEKAPNSVSSIVSNLLQNTPEYKTIDRKKSTTSTATTQDPTIQKESIPKTSFQFTNPNDFDLLSDSFDTTENIIPDSTEQVTVTEIPLSFNEIYTEQTILPNEELIISSLPEKTSVIETESDPKTDDISNNLSYSSVNAPRPFSRPNPTTRRVTYRTTTTQSPILVESNDNDEVSFNSQNRQIPSRNQIQTYSTLSPRTRTRPRYTERPSTETTAEERITRTYVNRGRGTARFRARPTKSGIYDQSLNAAGEAIVNEQLINENRLRAINFNRDNNKNIVQKQKSDNDNDTFVYTKDDIKEDSKIHKIQINDTIGRPDRYVFELTAGKKIEFGFSPKRPQPKAIDTTASKLNEDSPIVRVITGPLKKSPFSRKQGVVEEVPLLKTTTKTINLKEPTVNITSYSDKQKITEEQASAEITTEIPNVETTTFISAKDEDDTTFNPNVENVQSEGDTGFIPRLNNTTRRRPFIARRTSPVEVTTTTETPSTTSRQRTFRPIARRPTASAETSDSVARETEDSRPALIEGNRVVTRQRQRPRITGYRNRQNSAAEVTSREFTSTSSQTEAPTTRSRFRFTTSKAGISIKETFDITSDEEDFSNIILTDDFDGTTESISETTNQASGEIVDIETTSPTVSVSETTTRTPTRFATRRTIASRRRIVPTQETSERPEEPIIRLSNRDRFAIRNKSRRPILSVLKTESPDVVQRGDSNALTTPDDIESEENDDSSVSETTERVYTVPIDGDESTENDATESTKSEEVDTTRPVEIEPVRKRVKVFRQRTKPAKQEEEEVKSVEPTEPTSTQPPTRVRKTKIIRRPFKTATTEENDEEQPEAPQVSTTKTPRTRIIRRKKVKTEEPEEEAVSPDVITTTTIRTRNPASRRRVLKVLKKNVTESTATTEETASEPTGFTRSSTLRPSRLSYVRKINPSNENTVAVRRTLVRRPVTTTTTTTTEPAIELHDEDEDEEKEESHEDTKDVDDDDERDHHEEGVEEHVDRYAGGNSEEKTEDDVDEDEDEIVQRPAPRYSTRPSFSVRGPQTGTRRVPFIGTTRQSTVHPASTRFLSTQGGNVQTTKARRVTIRKQFVGSGLRKSTKAPTTATTSISTSAPLNTFTPIPYTEDSFITTTDYNEDFDHTELINNNENILQDLEEKVTGKKKSSLSASSRTTTVKPTTLYHVFAELPDDKKASEDNVNHIENNAEEIIKKLEKLIEINRVVEISGKEEIRKLSKNRKVKKIDFGSLMLLQPPTLNKVGEFSKLTLVKLAKLPESTEAPLITLDGRAQKSLFAETVFNTETSTISLEGLFDSEREKKSFDGEIETSTVPQTDSPDETTDPFISANNKESEVDPLVISITNLDKIKLNKVQSDETTTYKPSPVFIPSANIENDQAESNKVNVLLNSNSEINNQEILTTIRNPSSNSYNSRFTKRKQSPEVSKTIYSANRRGTTTTTTSAPVETTTENVRKFQRKPPNTFRRGSFNGLRNKTTSRNNQTEATTTVEAQTVSYPSHRRRVSTALYRKPVTTSTKVIENFETTTPVQRSSLLKFKTNDQGTDSSVATVQKDNNQLNQDADSLEEIAQALQSISNAPFREETTRHSYRKYEKTPLPKNHKLEGELYSLPEKSTTHHRQYFEEVVIPNFNNTSHRNINTNENPSTFDKIIKSNNLFTQSTISTIKPYDKLSDYYDDDEDMIIRKLNSQVKVIIHSDGKIECLDGAGSFPHPFDCKKFIQCGHTNSKKLIGWVFSCPQNLSYDPVGRICNWNFACKM